MKRRGAFWEAQWRLYASALKYRLSFCSIAEDYCVRCNKVEKRTIEWSALATCFELAKVRQWAVHPPSTGSAAPVIERALFPQRNTTSAPSSSVVTNFFVGCA